MQDLILAVYGCSQPLKVHFYLQSVYDLICMGADQVYFSVCLLKGLCNKYITHKGWVDLSVFRDVA